MSKLQPKFKVIILPANWRSGAHVFQVDDKQVMGTYDLPTRNGDYVYLTAYFGKGDRILRVEEVKDAEIEFEDRSTLDTWAEWTAKKILLGEL